MSELYRLRVRGHVDACPRPAVRGEPWGWVRDTPWLLLHVLADGRDRPLLATARDLHAIVSESGGGTRGRLVCTAEDIYATADRLDGLREALRGVLPDVPAGFDVEDLRVEPLARVGKLIRDCSYRNRWPVIGWDLPWLFGRWAEHAGNAQARGRGGFSLVLAGLGRFTDGTFVDAWEDSPALQVIPRPGGDTGGFYRWANPKTDRYRGKHPARFVDLRVLAGALGGGQVETPADAARLFDLTWPEPSDDPVARLRAEAAALGELATALFRAIVAAAPGLDPAAVQSFGTIATHLLAEAGVRPPLGKTRRLPPNDLGDAASATFGGRFDAALVGVALPAVLVDISKTYASLFALLGLDGVYGCREFRSEPRDPTLIASLLTDPAAIWQAETWAELGLTFVTLHPTGQPLPCSVELAPGRWRSMVAPLDLSGGSATYHWAEVLAAVVAGADPASIQIDRVFSIRPVGTQPDLTPVRLVTGRTVDLTSGELGAALVTEATRSDLPRWQRNLARATAQAISYGVLLRHDPIPRSGETSAVGPGGHRVTVRAARPERPGPFTFLPAGAAVCAATRLIIALLTAELRAAGSAAMAIHADSVTIPCTPTGESFPVDGASDGRLRTLTPGQLDQLLDGFAPLGITFRTEVANPDGCTHGLVVGVNKTVFAQHRADRSWQVVRSSDTGLGGSLADPSDTPGTRTPDGRWQWSATLETTMFPRDEPAPLPGWVDRPVVRRYTANTPAVLAQLRDELADPTVMPFARYLRAEPLVGTGGPVALGPWPDPARWAEAGWRLHGKPVTDPSRVLPGPPGGLAYTLTRTVSDYFTAWATPNDPSTTGPERGLRDPVPIRSALGLTVVVGRDSADLPDTEPDPAMPNPTSRLVYGHTAQAELRNRIRDIGPRRFSQQSGIAWSTVSQYVNDRPGSPQLTQRIAIALARYTPTPRATRLVPCGHCNKPTSRRRWCSDRCRMAATRAGAA